MKLYVSPLSRLHETLARSGGRRLVTLLSGSASFRRPDRIAEADFLHLTFHDIAEPRDGLTAPAPEHVRRLLAFASSTGESDALVIHCQMGISRSTAAAYAVACASKPGWSELQIAQELRRLAPSATPNPLIVAHADALLGRHGRMVDAIRGIGRGREAAEGLPFCLDLR